MLSHAYRPYAEKYPGRRGGYGGYDRPISIDFLAAVASTVDPPLIGFLMFF